MKIMISNLGLFFCLFFAKIAAQGTVPCHINRNFMVAPACTHITLPPTLCASCSRARLSRDHQYKNCRQVYNIHCRTCRNSLKFFIKLNPCDNIRRAQVEGWSAFDKLSLDYFVYSICEQCCQCIVKGLNKNNSKSITNEHTGEKQVLHNDIRGSCVAHAFYDICNIYPNVKYFTLPSGSRHTDWPPVCPLLYRWFQSSTSYNWINEDNVQIEEEMKQFLNNINVANQCKLKSVWGQCSSIEEIESVKKPYR